MKKKTNKWIQKIKIKQGSLSKQLGIPIEDNIPITLLEKIQNAKKGTIVKNPTLLGKQNVTATKLLQKRVNLALNLKRIRRR